MSGITAEEQVAKKCYKNQTAGGLGVVKLDHLGAQVGCYVAPYGTVWLTDNEALLTARAPALAKDNPFEEQMFQGYDDKGAIHDMPLRPLILIEDDREIPSGDRYVPGVPGAEADTGAVAAGQADTAAALASNTERTVPAEATVPVLVPSMTAAVPPSHAFPGAPPSATPPAAEADVAPAEQAESWVENPNATLTPQPGNLGGSNEPAPAAVQGDPATTGSPTSAPPQQPAPQAPPQAAPVEKQADPIPPEMTGQGPAPTLGESEGFAMSAPPEPAEETAAVTSTGEETGAAATPAGPPPQGEFAAAEEVGSPDAPTATPPPAPDGA